MRQQGRHSESAEARAASVLDAPAEAGAALDPAAPVGSRPDGRPARWGLPAWVVRVVLLAVALLAEGYLLHRPERALLAGLGGGAGGAVGILLGGMVGRRFGSARFGGPADRWIFGIAGPAIGNGYTACRHWRIPVPLLAPNAALAGLAFGFVAGLVIRWGSGEAAK